MSASRVLRRPASPARAVAALANATRAVVDASAGLALPAVGLPVLPAVVPVESGLGRPVARRGAPAAFWEGAGTAAAVAAALAAAPGPATKARRQKRASGLAIGQSERTEPVAVEPAASPLSPSEAAPAVRRTRPGAWADAVVMERLAAGDVDMALHVLRTPPIAAQVIDSDGQRLAHQAVSLVPAAALAVLGMPQVATLADHRGHTVAHTAVSFHEVAALTVLGRGGPMARLADGTGVTVAHAAVLHRACAHLVLGMPVIAALRDASGWTVLHEAVMQHASVGALALGSRLAVMPDRHGRTVAQTAVARHPAAALAAQRRAAVHPDVEAVRVQPSGVSLHEFAYIVHPFAQENAAREAAARR